MRHPIHLRLVGLVLIRIMLPVVIGLLLILWVLWFWGRASVQPQCFGPYCISVMGSTFTIQGVPSASDDL